MMSNFVLFVLLVGIVISSVPQSVPLHNAAAAGVRMPTMGLGVGAYGSPDGQYGEYWTDAVCAKAVTQFLRLGGRRIDTSLKWYHDLPGVGQALASAGVPREEVFVTSKVDDPFGEATTYAHIQEILQVLNTSYIDLVLMHWPAPMGWDFATTSFNTTAVYDQACGSPAACRVGTYRGMLRALKDGLVKAVGVANFEPSHIADLTAAGLPLPAVNQLEFHVYWHEDAWVRELQAMNVTVNSYSPLGAPDYMAFLPHKWPVLPMQVPAVQAIAAETSRSPAQVLLRWALQKDIVVNPRSWNATHMRENLDVYDFALTDAQMAILDQIDAPLRNKVCPDPILLA